MNRNNALFLSVPAFLILFTTFQNFEEIEGDTGKVDFSTIVDESYLDMKEAKKSAQDRKLHYQQLRKQEVLNNEIQPKYYIDHEFQSPVFEENAQISVEKKPVRQRESASVPDPALAVEQEFMQADK